MPLCLTLHYKARIMSKVEQSREWSGTISYIRSPLIKVDYLETTTPGKNLESSHSAVFLMFILYFYG